MSSSEEIDMILRILSLSINTAKRAGGIIRDVMTTGELGIVEKAKNDLQTEADRSAQRCIIASLTKQFPTIKVIGEEGISDLTNLPQGWLVNEFEQSVLKKECPSEYKNAKDGDFVVWVDPLDGTSEYTAGFVEHVTVLIGIAIKEVAVAGVIHQPFYKNSNGELGRTIWGMRGVGVEGFTPTSPPDSQFILTTTRSHSTAVVQNALDALNPTKILRVGGAGYKVLQLLEGNAHAYVFASPGCKKWDTCAPEAILEAHGGVLTDMLGSHYNYNGIQDEQIGFLNKAGVLATAKGICHKEIVAKIPQDIKNVLSK